MDVWSKIAFSNVNFDPPAIWSLPAFFKKNQNTNLINLDADLEDESKMRVKHGEIPACPAFLQAPFWSNCSAAEARFGVWWT